MLVYFPLLICLLQSGDVLGFGINLIKVPEDDRSQIFCTIALLRKYFHSGETLSGSVISMSITSASSRVQENLLKAIHCDTEAWTVVVKNAREDAVAAGPMQILHEKPQCYFLILENLEDEDLDDIFEDWKTNVNWNPLAQFVVYLASVEETDDEMTELMIEILLNFMNKKIYNVNVIGQNEENGFYYGKTVFPYHPDNNCGNRVITIETLDICDYQETDKEEEDEDEEEDYENQNYEDKNYLDDTQVELSGEENVGNEDENGGNDNESDNGENNPIEPSEEEENEGDVNEPIEPAEEEENEGDVNEIDEEEGTQDDKDEKEELDKSQEHGIDEDIQGEPDKEETDKNVDDVEEEGTTEGVVEDELEGGIEQEDEMAKEEGDEKKEEEEVVGDNKEVEGAVNNEPIDKFEETGDENDIKEEEDGNSKEEGEQTSEEVKKEVEEKSEDKTVENKVNKEQDDKELDKNNDIDEKEEVSNEEKEKEVEGEVNIESDDAVENEDVGESEEEVENEMEDDELPKTSEEEIKYEEIKVAEYRIEDKAKKVMEQEKGNIYYDVLKQASKKNLKKKNKVKDGEKASVKVKRKSRKSLPKYKNKKQIKTIKRYKKEVVEEAEAESEEEETDTEINTEQSLEETENEINTEQSLEENEISKDEESADEEAESSVQSEELANSSESSNNSSGDSTAKFYLEELYPALFLDKFPKDLSGCPLVAAYRPWEPYIFNEVSVEADYDQESTELTDTVGSGSGAALDGEEYEENRNEYGGEEYEGEENTPEVKLSGIEYKMVETIGERLHISIDLQVENTNLYHLFQLLIDGDIEMVVGGIDEDPSISQFVSSTIPYHQDDLTWCVAKAKRKHNLFNFLASFQLGVWLLTLVFIMVTALNVVFIRRLLRVHLWNFQGYFTIMIRILGITLSQSTRLFGRTPKALKLTLYAAFFMALMFNNVYQSFLVSTLTNPKSSAQISHIEEIYRHRMTIMGSVENVRHLNKEGEIFKYIREKFQMCYNIEDCLSRAAHDEGLAVAVSRQHSFYNPRIPRDRLYCFDRDENMYVYLVTMLLPKKFHLLHKINPVIQHIIESGHMQKWARDLDMKRKIHEEIHRAREDQFQSLNLAQVIGTFVFSGFLILYATFMFILEKWTYWMVTKRRTRLKPVKFLHKKFKQY